MITIITIGIVTITNLILFAMANPGEVVKEEYDCSADEKVKEFYFG